MAGIGLILAAPVVRAELFRHCRAERIESPTPPRVTRMVRSALHNAEETWFSVIAARISPGATASVLALIDGGTASGDDEDEDEEDEEDEDADSVLALVR